MRTELVPEVALDIVVHWACCWQDLAICCGLDHKDRLGCFGDRTGRLYDGCGCGSRDSHGEGRGRAIDHTDRGVDGGGGCCCDGGAT